jgi:hypothetical protein
MLEIQNPALLLILITKMFFYQNDNNYNDVFVIAAFSKLLILCDLYSRRKSELSREERYDIIKYAKSR